MSASTATHSTGKVAPTTASRFTFDVLRHDGPVLVDFHAPWCRTCQVLEPVLDDLAATWADRLRIVSIDIERHPGAAQRHHIQSIPSLVLFDRGTEQDRLINVVRRERIDDWLHDHLDGPSGASLVGGRIGSARTVSTTPEHHPRVRSEGGHHDTEPA